MYRRHSGYPGGLTEIPYRRLLETHPERAIERAVKGMLPHTRLGRRQVHKLKVYAGPSHPHESQKPEPLSVDGPIPVSVQLAERPKASAKQARRPKTKAPEPAPAATQAKKKVSPRKSKAKAGGKATARKSTARRSGKKKED
jgi:hypothetical protein